jgi:TonB family protein
VLLWTSVATACASSGSASVAADQVEVEKPATLIPGVGSAPVYPVALLGPSAVPGRVVLELTVRADGTVDSESLLVVATSDSAFVAPVLAAVPTWRFLPHERGPLRGPLMRYEQRIRMPIVVAVPPAAARR